MTLMTEKLKQELLLQCNEKKFYERSDESFVILEFFHLFGRGAWLITHVEDMPNGDLQLYGLIHLFCSEWGNVMLSDLESLGFMIERNKGMTKGVKVSERRKQLGI